jgi:hypothetical protein
MLLGGKLSLGCSYGLEQLGSYCGQLGLDGLGIGGNLQALGGLCRQALELPQHLAETKDGLAQAAASDASGPVQAVAFVAAL